MSICPASDRIGFEVFHQKLTLSITNISPKECIDIFNYSMKKGCIECLKVILPYIPIDIRNDPYLYIKKSNNKHYLKLLEYLWNHIHDFVPNFDSIQL
jgi:hypothetical protein